MGLIEQVYRNAGNNELLALVPKTAHRVLDVGCGAGDNARILTQAGHEVVGVTLSPAEAQSAARYCRRVEIVDLEHDRMPFEEGSFDLLLMSHVLEHVRDPAAVLDTLSPLIPLGASALIAVPSMSHWRLRWRFLRGDWRRNDDGPMDRTHVQFWSYETAAELLAGSPFELTRRLAGHISIPLWPMRRLTPTLCGTLDRVVGSRIPALAAGQVLLVARRVR